MVTITLRYFAAARAAAGVSTQTVQASSVAEALATVRAQHSPRFADVLDGCAILVDGAAVSDQTRTLAAATEVHVLPPFAGG